MARPADIQDGDQEVFPDVTKSDFEIMLYHGKCFFIYFARLCHHTSSVLIKCYLGYMPESLSALIMLVFEASGCSLFKAVCRKELEYHTFAKESKH